MVLFFNVYLVGLNRPIRRNCECFRKLIKYSGKFTNLFSIKIWSGFGNGKCVITYNWVSEGSEKDDWLDAKMKLFMKLLSISLLWTTARGNEDSSSGTTCPPGTFGRLSCEEKCGHCAGNGACDIDNGNCTDGCTSNWFKLPDCKLCADGYFGQNDCSTKCHCKDNVSCDATTGKCPGDCEVGYEGKNCQKLTGLPVIDSISLEPAVNINETFSVQCTASGAPEPQITMTYINVDMIEDQPVIHTGGDQYVKSMEIMAPDISNETIEIVCNVVNVHGLAKLEQSAVTVDPPSLIDYPMVSDAEVTSIKISWKKWEFGHDKGGHVEDDPSYMVVYQLNEQTNWTNALVDWQKEISAVVNNLKPNSDYKFSIRCKRGDSDYGIGPVGPFAQGVTKCQLPNEKKQFRRI
ncbi:tyrosine kinase with immunoglobulin-like and EGF-like domains 1 [Chamberlinius hualienensis]